MRSVWATPRPVPASHLPSLAGGLVVAFALPVFALAGLPLRGWALGAVLWTAAEALGLVLARLPLGADNLAAAGARGVGMMFRPVAVMVVVIVVAAQDAALGVSAGVVYATAYTLELVLSLTAYFTSESLR